MLCFGNRRAVIGRRACRLLTGILAISATTGMHQYSSDQHESRNSDVRHNQLCTCSLPAPSRPACGAGGCVIQHRDSGELTCRFPQFIHDHVVQANYVKASKPFSHKTLVIRPQYVRADESHLGSVAFETAWHFIRKS